MASKTLQKAEARRKAREAEYMSLADGVGIIPSEYRNRAYKKLNAEPGTVGILLEDAEMRARRGAGGVDEDKLGAAIGAALGAALAPIQARLDELGGRDEATGSTPEKPAAKQGNGKQSNGNS